MGSTIDTLKNMIKKIQDKARCDCPGSTDISIELKPYQWEYVIKALEMAIIWEADDETEVESYYD